jgi:hypothetical protein
MMSGIPFETCWTFNKRWNNKFYYKVTFCWLFIRIQTTMHASVNIKFYLLIYIFFYLGATAHSGPRPPYCREFTVTLRHTTVGRTPLDEWSSRRRDLYLTTHDTHNRQISMPLVGLEPTIPASERQQTNALDLAATGTVILRCTCTY